MPETEKAATIAQMCQSIAVGRAIDAATIAKRDYPFVARLPVGRHFDDVTAARVFVRDGFIDRYTGDKLVFPGVLRVLSQLLPDEFPYHPNWKMSATHPAYWELFPTIDHVVPVVRGGSDDEANWVTTSMLRNSVKDLWLLEELGWQLRPSGDVHMWDGLMGWFLRFVQTDSRLRTSQYIRRWYRAALQCR
jgi:hypothetical protein